jgi:outer membrane lipoprotein-sorting protein
LEVYDGTYLWVYVPTDKEVQRQKKESARTPFRPKEILEKLKQDFVPELKQEGKQRVVLHLRPRVRGNATPPVLLVFHPKSFLINSMNWEEAGDSVTVKFLRTGLNVKISPKKFAFAPPRGVKITDLSL